MLTPHLTNYGREYAMTYKVKIMPFALSQLSETVKYFGNSACSRNSGKMARRVTRVDCFFERNAKPLSSGR